MTHLCQSPYGQVPNIPRAKYSPELELEVGEQFLWHREKVAKKDFSRGLVIDLPQVWKSQQHVPDGFIREATFLQADLLQLEIAWGRRTPGSGLCVERRFRLLQLRGGIGGVE